MSTWQIVSGADGFRWEVGGRIIRSDSDSTSQCSHLPSMDDLLLQGCSKLLELEDTVSGELPMFRTGLGRPVVLKQSSIARATSILADSKVSDSEHLQSIGCSKLHEKEQDISGTLPLFKTASGKPLTLKESSITKALSVLGVDNMADSGMVPAGESRLGHANSFFQTGSAKKVSVSSAGLARAKALLGLEEEDLNGFNLVKELSSSCQRVGFKSLAPKLYEVELSRKQPVVLNTSSKAPPIMFQTAGGRSLSVSSEALDRARSLLGNPELGNFLEDVAVGDEFFTPQKDQRSDGTTISNGSGSLGSFHHQGKTSNEHTPNCFISPLRSSSKQSTYKVNTENLISGSNLIKKFDAVVDEGDSALILKRPALQDLSSNKPSRSDFSVNISKENFCSSRVKQIGRPADRLLSDIINHSSTAYANNKRPSSKVKRLGYAASVSPFKRPRSSTFHTPFKENTQHAPSGSSFASSNSASSKKVISTRYPQRIQRVSMKEYFGIHPSAKSKLDHLPDHAKRITSSNADKYVFRDKSGANMFGAQAFLLLLAESGASLQHISKEWVTNHYRWVVWKLACYEKYNPAKHAGNFLTVSNVLEELKYRCEREVNRGHCSAIKRILSGDAPASSMMVLCVAAIRPRINNGSDYGNNARIELTDGWYAMDAALDVELTKLLNAGKLFVGQKLRIWGAGLCGWVGPTSPLEAGNRSTIYLLLNANGTYRAHWADRLGFCKGVGNPLAFSCIKSNGGPVPRTLAGITRIYPILYKERLNTGKFVVRSERTESRMVELHNQRRSALVEDLISEYQRGISGFDSQNESDSEGAKLFRLLENAAEPEFLMADMSAEQLTSYTMYKAKLEAARQTEHEKSMGKALKDAGLGERDVTPFMRVRVVGLTSRNCSGKHKPKEGVVTIWNPMEEQLTGLTEGKIYDIKGLEPLNLDLEILHLRARGPSTRWQPLSSEASQTFHPFFHPRESARLSNLGEVPLSSEFDIAAYVVYVGEVYTEGQQKKQWVFVADGSCSHSESGIQSNNLLAIGFSLPDMDGILLPPINSNLAGSTVGFCNLIRKPKDEMNNLWVAETTQNSIYFLNLESPYCRHLRAARDNVQRWVNISTSVIDNLRQRVLFMITCCN